MKCIRCGILDVAEDSDLCHACRGDDADYDSVAPLDSDDGHGDSGDDDPGGAL